MKSADAASGGVQRTGVGAYLQRPTARPHSGSTSTCSRRASPIGLLLLYCYVSTIGRHPPCGSARGIWGGDTGGWPGCA